MVLVVLQVPTWNGMVMRRVARAAFDERQPGLRDWQTVCVCRHDRAGSGPAFRQTKADNQANRCAQKFSRPLLPDLYRAWNRMFCDAACDKEVDSAIDLREGGFGV